MQKLTVLLVVALFATLSAFAETQNPYNVPDNGAKSGTLIVNGSVNFVALNVTPPEQEMNLPGIDPGTSVSDWDKQAWYTVTGAIGYKVKVWCEVAVGGDQLGGYMPHFKAYVTNTEEDTSNPIPTQLGFGPVYHTINSSGTFYVGIQCTGATAEPGAHVGVRTFVFTGYAEYSE